MPASYLRASTLAALFVVAASFGPVRAQAQNGFSEARNANIDISGARSARIEAFGAPAAAASPTTRSRAQ